jgi:hypothetical protein
VPDRVDAPVNAVQPAGRYAPANGGLGQAGGAELSGGDDPILLPGERGHQGIRRVRAEFPFTFDGSTAHTRRLPRRGLRDKVLV